MSTEAKPGWFFPRSLKMLFLQAAAELELRQAELLPLVAKALGYDPWEYWMSSGFEGPRRPGSWDSIVIVTEENRPQEEAKCEQSGVTGDGEWRWFFHGCEIDIDHIEDGRRVRVDFGRRDHGIGFSGFGVSQFVARSKPPWNQYPRLRRYLIDWNGWEDNEKAAHLCKRLMKAALIRPLDGEPPLCPTNFTLTDAGRKLVA